MAKSKKTTKSTVATKPPVVTIMGHVDHGKTSLLDFIRHSRLTAKEAGGITQHIGAYTITHQGQPITFIDTPGHAAFSQMRARGAAITDIVILVVAADDGVMPQTRESIKHLKQAGVPIIVAINKMDLPNAVPDMAKAQLTELDIKVEGYGGNVPVVEISATKGTNVDKLLETILVLSELESITADPQAPLETVVLEASHQKNLGPVVTLLVKQGTLRATDSITSVLTTPTITAKLKRLTNETNQTVSEVTPGYAVQAIGFKDVPHAGTIFTHPQTTSQVIDSVSQFLKDLNTPTAPTQPEPTPEPSPADPEAPTDETTPTPEPSSEPTPSIKILLKADTDGSLQAVRANLPSEVEVIQAATGQVTESDVLMAQATQAVIIAFHTPVAKTAKKLAKVEKVPIHTYQIIYKLLEEFESQILKLLEPTIDEEELGRGTIQALFTIKDQKIAGLKLNSGKFNLGASVHIKRGDRIFADAKIASLKQGKVDANEVTAPSECGLVLKPTLNLAEGDVIIAFRSLDTA